MMASLFSGVSGLKNHQVKMNVIGNNIANINTIGYKASRVNFQEALVQTQRGAGRPTSVQGGTNPVQLGLGMEVSTIDNLWSQGGLETTGQITDLAIQGNGFFILGDMNGNQYYTRAGAFGFDANANLVDPSSGLLVMGKMADRNGEIPSFATMSSITLPFGQQDPANATTEVAVANNLDSSATDSESSVESPGYSNVLTASGYAADGVGGTHTISIIGEQAQFAEFHSVAGLSLSTTLTSQGVNVFDDLTIAVDGGDPESIPGLDASSTVEDLINALNLISGISAELDTGTGEIIITRGKAGSASDYYFESSAGVDSGGNLNIASAIFGAADGATFNSATQADVTRRGAASTYVATDSFLPSQGTGAAAGPIVTPLDLVYDTNDGLVIGLDGIGDGGITLKTGTGGLASTYEDPLDPGSVNHPLVIDTADTTHTTSISVYDSQGGKHTMSVTFFKSVIDNRWEWSVDTLGNERVTTGASGYVIFNADGSLNAYDYNGGANAVTIDPQNGAENMTIALDFGTPGEFDGMTQFATGTHTASIVSQDGYGLGILEQIAIDGNGVISGIFSNGITRPLAQIMLADFPNQGGLRKSGSSQYQPTGNSGEPREGFAGETIGAELFSGALESSSVDVAEEFTGMITAQRGYQANARIITTSDTMLEELVNIKR